MNEFVRRPSRRRDNRVYVPAADIIKRTIRRSWTISNPTPRWNSLRGSPEIRPYNSLPRGQDISNYPSLIPHQTAKQDHKELPTPSPRISPVSPRKHSPARRSHSEDVYSDVKSQDQTSVKTDLSQTPPASSDSDTKSAKGSPPVRVNPLIKFAAERRQSSLGPEAPKARRRLQATKAHSEPVSATNLENEAVQNVEETVQERKRHGGTPEKRVSFDDERICRDGDRETKHSVLSKKFEASTSIEKGHTESVETANVNNGSKEKDEPVAEVQSAIKEDGPAIELCDIEPISGTVFRKVTVRRRRQDIRKISTSDNGWRTGRPDGDLIDILLPEGDDYKLVFISSSDSSSKEEDVDDNDSTASSFPFDDCDWDYFEPGGSNSKMLNWNSPFGSPGVYRRSALESPIGSPLVYRRTRFSDIGTDEDNNIRIDSPASSDGNFSIRNSNEENAMDDVSLQCVHQANNEVNELPQKPCQSCGAPTQYVPIPVPVPIPIPMLWTAQDSLVLYNNNSPESLEHNLKTRLRRSVLPLLNQAAFIWPLINDTDPNNLFLSALQSEVASLMTASTATTTALNVSKAPSAAANDTTAAGKPTAPTTSSSSIPDNFDDKSNNLGNRNEYETNMNEKNDEDMTVKRKDCIPEDYGYLLSEYKYASSSTSSAESDESDREPNKPRVKRTYNVTGGDTTTSSDDALPSSEVSDEENNVASRESSQIEEDSNSDSVDTDDTGTVADKRTNKKFSCVYVVNKRRSTSEESRSDSENTSEDEESGIILTHVKHFSDSREILNEDNRKNNGSSDFDKNSGDKNYSDTTPSPSVINKNLINAKTNNKDVKDNKEQQRKTIEACDNDSNSDSSDNSNDTSSESSINKSNKSSKCNKTKKKRVNKFNDDSDDNDQNERNTRDPTRNKEDCSEDADIVLIKIKFKDQEIEENICDSSPEKPINTSESPISPKNRSEINENSQDTKSSDNLSDTNKLNAKLESNKKEKTKKYRKISKKGRLLSVSDSENSDDSDNTVRITKKNLKKTRQSSDSSDEKGAVQLKRCKKIRRKSKGGSSSDKSSSHSDSCDEKQNLVVSRSNSDTGNEKLITEKCDFAGDQVEIRELRDKNEIEKREHVNESILQQKTDTVCDFLNKSTLNCENNDKAIQSADDHVKAENVFVESNLRLQKDEVSNSDEGGSDKNVDNLADNRVNDDDNANENDELLLEESFSIENLEEIARFDVDSAITPLQREIPILKIENDAEVVENPLASLGAEQQDMPLHNLGTSSGFKDSLKEYMSSPGLSDVSAESLSSSSDTEQRQEKSRYSSSSSSSNAAGGDRQISERRGECTGGTGSGESDCTVSQRNAARYTSLVMITQENNAVAYPQVSVVTSDTTTLVPDATDEIVVRHTNWQLEENAKEKGRYFNNESSDKDANHLEANDVTVITGGDTLSAVICLEEGLADDDSWVENLSHNEDDFIGSTDDTSSGEEVTITCSDQEDELRGYHRTAIDFTLHTIVEESCEESEVEQSQNKKQRPKSATDLEKYFYYGLGDGTIPSIGSSNRAEDAFSETSSICSESMDSIGGGDKTPPNESTDPAELASSRLENYFLSGFMGFTASRRDSDGSVGSDSEGEPSPEQRRKRLVRARGTGRSHSSSLDNLLANPELSGAEQQSENQCSEDSSSDSDTYDEGNNFEKSDGQFDTVKRKKNKKKNIGTSSPDESKLSDNNILEDEQIKSEKEDKLQHQQDTNNLDNDRKQQRDSGFIGSSDDLIKDQKDIGSPDNVQSKFERIQTQKIEERLMSGPPTTALTRKDSFNNWSSDEETNLMMCKMRQFFKTMVAANNQNQSNPSSKPSTPIMGMNSPKTFASPKLRSKTKPPQLVYFENELTRLMKTVPGIRDDQVREIVEYLSSEDTWSDSYDSSDYTSSDLEGTSCTKTALQQQISDSCQQIINKFDKNVEDEEGDEGDGGIIDETSQGLNKETAFVYQKLVASFEKMATGDNPEKKTINPHNSPPLIAKVMHHIGKRLVALMHEVSSGESHCSNSPKTKHYHRRLQQKLYSTASSTTTEDDDSTSDSNLPDTLSNLEEVTCYNLLPRSRSHDLLVSENRNLHQSSSGVSDIAEEREISDCERFSWRGSFESALLATDSRNKLSAIGGEGSASASALAIAAKRRSAGDLLFSHKSLSREQLDRVRSCGSIGGGNSEDKLWVTPAPRPSKRRSSVPDTTSGSGDSADGEEDDEDCEEDDEDHEEDLENRSTLPRSLQSGPATTNSLPRLPTTNTNTAQTATNMHKAHSMYHFLQQNVKSARYRPPGFNRLTTTVPKRAVSAPGLQPTHQRRSRHNKQQSTLLNGE
ncbi:hypothetical protein AMK59_2270 [Oryctes borbonicus]|uniref:Uncharacterized protein n=1 Tax=Oryctes borbonicus TaxID=1629725 RepID=A0A0T6BBQ0_9SCAR|nr:hypothetical protein AMK59_2270 [Oryctes borbonicus]